MNTLAYIKFCEDVWAKVKQDQPNLPESQYHSTIGLMWNKLSHQERGKYNSTTNWMSWDPTLNTKPAVQDPGELVSITDQCDKVILCIKECCLTDIVPQYCLHGNP